MILLPLPLPNTPWFLAMAAVFTILVIVYRYALGGMTLGSRWQRLPLAVAAAVLSVLGMFGLGRASGSGESTGSLPAILLPYEALGFTLLLLPLVLLVAAAWERRFSPRERRNERRSKQSFGKDDPAPKRGRAAKLRSNSDA